MKDIAVAGGGASGLSFAVMVKEQIPDVSVTVFEAADRVGRKLAVTGNGRCNISNSRQRPYHGGADFAEKIVSRFDYAAQKEFFKNLGVLFLEQDDKAYPMSLQASSVVDALRFRATESGVEIVTGARVASVQKQNGLFRIDADPADGYRVFVTACGGRAGGKLGSDDGYRLLKAFGHKIERLSPAIVQVKTETADVRQLKGVKVNASVTVKSSAGRRTEYGEVLFCDYGLSGPPVLQVSRLAESGTHICLDILPEMTASEIEREIIRRTETFADRPAAELFTGFLNKRLGQIVLKKHGIHINSPCKTVNNASEIAGTLKNWDFAVTGTTGFENAQVTAGGAQTNQFFASCMSKKVRGLFAIGEVLDVDGDCGGYNLAFAWASAMAAAKGAAEYLKKEKV